MAKLEIPSIVVHSGSPSVPGVSMERTTRQTPQLRKQKSSLDEGDLGSSGCSHSKFEATNSALSNPVNSSCSNNNNQQASTKSDDSPGTSNKPGSPGGVVGKNEDVDRPSGPQPQLSRSRSNAKMKMLTRSHAMREATSPPPDPSATTLGTSTTTSSNSSNAQSSSPTIVSNGSGKNSGQASKFSNNSGSGNNNNHHSSNNNNNGSTNNNYNNNNSKTKNGNSKNNKEHNNMSNRGSHRQIKNVIYVSSPQEDWKDLLYRDISTDSQYQDASKADLEGFIAQQMSTKNRALLLRVEEELVRLVQDSRVVYYRFPQMTSFHRMLVHRASTYYNLEHNLDSSVTCVVVNRNKNTRMPERSFLQILRDVKGLSSRAYSSEEPRKSILKRDFASFEDSQYKSDEKQLSLESRRSKSFEEREEEYERARRRIFSRDDSTDSCHQNSDSNPDSMEDVRWSECATWSGDEPEPPGRYLRPNDRSSRLHKAESYDKDSLKGNTIRSAVSKSYSFGGYTGNGGSNGRTGPSHGQSLSGLQRGDSNTSSLSSGSRMLAKQDSGSSGSSCLSPSSSGYKSQSQQSDATLSATPSPTDTPLLPMSSQGSQDTLSPEPPVILPMTAMGNIPPGSVLINPATGQPICNADGSVYRYDPDNPLTLHVPRPESPSKSNPATQSGRQNEKENNSKSDAGLDQGGVSPEPQPATTSSPTPSSKLSSNQTEPAKITTAVSTTSTSTTYSKASGDVTSDPPEHHKSYTKEDKRSPKEPASLGVPPEGRNLASAATSPMLVASPQRQPPAQAGQPIVVGGGPGGPTAGYAVAGSPMMSVPVSYSVPPHYHNGGYATYPDGQHYVNGYSPYPVAGYPVSVDPNTGAYVPPQQPQQPPPTGPPTGPPPPPCCVPGYPCPYATPAAPHAGYDQRGPDTGGQGVADMTTYMMGLSIDHRAGGDAGAVSVAGRPDGPSPQQIPGAPPGPHVMVAGNGSYYWGPQLSSHNQGYPSTVMYYYPPNNVQSPQNSGSSGPGSTPVSVNSSNSNYSNRGTSPNTNNRDNSSNKNNSNSSGSISTNTGSNRNNYNRNVVASYAKGAAIYQPPVYSMPNMQVAPQPQDRTVINGYPNDCMPVGGPQQQVVYTVSSMHSSTVPTQSYQPTVYSNASATMSTSGTAPASAITYYQGVQGAGDSGSQPPGQQLLPMGPYAGPQGYMPTPGTPPLTPQSSYGVHPYVYGMYSPTANGPGGPASPATYPNVAPHQSPMMPRMMRPNLIVGGVQSSPPPRNVGPKGFPRGQSPVGRKDQSGSGDSTRFSQPYSMYNLAASRYMSGDMRYMPGRLPFSIPTNTYHRAMRPFQTSYYPRPHSQPSGEALGLTRPPRVRKPTSPHTRSPARGPFVGREYKAFSKPPVVMKTS